MAFRVQLTEAQWERVHGETFDAIAGLCELNSQNDQKLENDGLRRFLVMQPSSYKDLENEVLTRAKFLHPGISGSQRFRDEIPSLLLTLAGALGQMGH